MSWKGSAVVGGVGGEKTEYTAAGAIALTDDVAVLDTTAGALAFTLADGAAGNRVFIILETDGGDAVVTVNLQGADNTLTFADAGDAVELIFDGTAWQVLSNIGSVTPSTV